MVLAMKLISFAFDLDSGAIHNLPNIFEYFGYAFHVGTVVFGPWISYQDYVFSISNDKAKKLVSLNAQSTISLSVQHYLIGLNILFSVGILLVLQTGQKPPRLFLLCHHFHMCGPLAHSRL